MKRITDIFTVSIWLFPFSSVTFRFNWKLVSTVTAGAIKDTLSGLFSSMIRLILLSLSNDHVDVKSVLSSSEASPKTSTVSPE